MTDFLVCAPSLADIEAIAQNITGLWAPEVTSGPNGDIPAHINPGGNSPVGWAWAPLGTWYVQSGDTVPNMVPKDSNFYGLLRWNGDLADMPLPQGVSIVTTNSPTPTYTITIGSFSMVSPVDPTFPLRFA